MKRLYLPLKLAALACSSLLVSGFVAYRAGAFNGMMRGTPPPAQADSPAPSGTFLIDGTSKSGHILDPSVLQQAASPGKAPPITTLGGSKSLAPLIPPTPSSGGSQAPAP